MSDDCLGKSYRIARADLETVAGASLPTPSRQAVARQRQAQASSVIRVDAVSPDLRDRVAGLISGIAASPSESSERLHITINFTDIEPTRIAAPALVVIGQTTHS